MLILLEAFWITFDRFVTFQVYYPPPRPYIRPTESSPLSPFYGPDYDRFQGPSRVFPTKAFPCDDLMSEQNFRNPGTVWKNSFVYVMQPHAAGITLAGVASRIARNVASRKHRIEPGSNRTACATWNAAVRARRLKDRVKDKSFLWSVVREPVDRMLSRFFHETVSLEGKVGNVENFKKFVDDGTSLEYGVAVKTLTMRSFGRRMSPYGGLDIIQHHVQEILNEYDFLGILERLHESLAVLQLLLGLETQDVLYLTMRSADAFGGAAFTILTNPKSGERKCAKLQPKRASLAFKEFLHQPYLFEEVFEADVYLYKAINASLDATIESLGHEKVDQAVKRLQWGQKQVNKRCSKTAIFPCSNEGPTTPSTDCLVDDVSCGYQCIDSIGKTLSKDPDFLQL
jgi:Sulfotransferase family